jgi:hypothetical protein
MYKIILLQLLLLVKLLKLIRFNLHLAVKIKIKRNGRERIRRKKIIINNPINPRLGLLMIKKIVNLIILVLSVVRIIIRKIVHDVLRLLSSYKGPGHSYTHHFVTTFSFLALGPIGHPFSLYHILCTYVYW